VCTTNPKGREVSPTEYQENYDKADALFAENIDPYKQRQMIVEHPFGTVKRALGYTYFLLRGHENVKCESCMHFFIYNFKWVINILGITPLLDTIKAKIAKANKETALFYCAFLINFRILSRYGKIPT